MLYHTPECGPKAAALKRAMRKAFDLSKSITLAIHTKNQLSGVVEDVLGPNPVKALKKDNAFSSGGLEIHLLTERISDRLADRPIVCSHISFAFLESLMQQHPRRDIVYVPWMEKELAAFLSKYTSTAI